MVRHWAVSISNLRWDINLVCKINKIVKARGPPKRGARGICHFCHMVNLAPTVAVVIVAVAPTVAVATIAIVAVATVAYPHARLSLSLPHRCQQYFRWEITLFTVIRAFQLENVPLISAFMQENYSRFST